MLLIHGLTIRSAAPGKNGSMVKNLIPPWSPTGYLQKKQIQPMKEEPIIGDASLNYVYLRYADILLMKAEALNELGRSPEALSPLNDVRKRARESYLYDETLQGLVLYPVTYSPMSLQQISKLCVMPYDMNAE